MLSRREPPAGCRGRPLDASLRWSKYLIGDLMPVAGIQPRGWSRRMPRNGPSDLDVTVATQRRAQIMRAVMASIADEGLERTTLRNVAERAGVSTGTIAYYFKGKKEMVDAALLEASHAYMEGWYANRGGGPWSLDHLVVNFLATDNTDAGFVLQMIEVGLHNSELRGTHQEMIEAGRMKIEESLRQG